MNTANILETYTINDTLTAARAYYNTGPRPNILQYPCDYIATYPLRDSEGFPEIDDYWVPVVYRTDQGFAAQVEEASGHVENVGMFASFAEAAFEAHDRAFDMATEINDAQREG